MKLTKHFHLGISFFIISFICALASVLLRMHFNNAISFVCLLFFAIVAVVMLIEAFVKTFSERDGIDTDELNKPIKINLKYIGIAALIILFCVGIKNPFKPAITMYNRNISYVNSFEKVQQERKMFYDKMWKTYLTKNTICELNKETFIEVTSIIMQGRSDGQNVSWKIVHENQNIPYDKFTTFYTDLSNFVTSQREEYYKLETQAMSIVQQQNGMLDSFPNNIYNKVLDIKKLNYNPGFTSSRTETVFKDKSENF